MKISWKLLNQILDLSYTTYNEIAHYLTTVGFEVDDFQELVVNNAKDIILNILPTPNRNDIFNTVNVAKEIAVILQQRLMFNFCNLAFFSQKNNHNNFTFHSSCSYIVSIISNVQCTNSPNWIKNYLASIDQESFNSIVDIKKYIKLKWGQDLEIFNISDVYMFNQQNNITLQSGLECHWGQDNYDTKSFSVMINGRFIVSLNIDNNQVFDSRYIILIVASISNNATIKHHSNILVNELTKNEINSENNVLCLAMQESSFLYKRLCYGLTQDRQILNPYKHIKVVIKVSQYNLNRTLGPITTRQLALNVYHQQITEILDLLSLNPIKCSKHWLVAIPRFRQHDLKREIDVIEEIARIYGFQYFNDIIPFTYINKKVSLRQLLVRQVRFFLRSIGLHELVHSSLLKEQGINLFNPLSDEYNGLRADLVIRLTQLLSYNLHQTNSELQGFEIGKVFYTNRSDDIVNEKLHLGIIWSCQNYLRANWSNKAARLSWFQAKGMISNFCQSIGVSLSWDKLTENCSLKHLVHSRRSAILYYKQRKIGFFGESNPQLCYKLGIKKRFYLCELDLDTITHYLKTNCIVQPQFKSYSKYPCIVRDISIITARSLRLSFIISKINSISSPFIKSIQLFDEYLGNQIPLNKKSLSFRVEYQSLNTTLTNVEIAKLDRKLRHILCTELNAQIR